MFRCFDKLGNHKLGNHKLGNRSRNAVTELVEVTARFEKNILSTKI